MGLSKGRSHKEPAENKNQKWYKKISVWVSGVITAVLIGVLIAYFSGMFAPKTLSAKLEKPLVYTNVTLKKHLEGIGQPLSSYTSEELSQNGYLVNIHVRLVGFKGRKCTLRWSAYDANKSSVVLPEPWKEFQDPVDFIPEQADDSGGASFWVPDLKSGRAFLVRISIHDDKGNELDAKETDLIKPHPASG